MSEHIFTADQIERDDDEAGVHLSQIAEAITTWAAMNVRQLTVADAMATFNTTREVVLEAVRFGMWCLLWPEECDNPTKQTIEVDGE